MNENTQYISYADWLCQNERQKKAEKRDIRYLGLLAGAAILSMILVQNIFTLGMRVVGVYDNYIKNAAFQTGVDILISIFSILVPFLIFSRPMKKRTGIETVAPLEKPVDTKLALLGIIAGLGLCMLANLATSYLTIFIEAFGFKLSAPDIPNPEGSAGFFISMLRVAVVAAMAEELSLRGCVMQPLRKYGDGFAIAMSACTFGLMHCNLIQAPFALIVGFELGYIAIKTGSLWPSIIVHALNNGISTAISYLLDKKLDENLLNVIYFLIIYGFIFVGLIALAFFNKRAKFFSPSESRKTALSFPAKAFAYITNPTMIIAILLMLFVTSSFVARK